MEATDSKEILSVQNNRIKFTWVKLLDDKISKIQYRQYFSLQSSVIHNVYVHERGAKIAKHQ